CQQYNDWNTF
nr:immunoglobulin light chain junction region [Macaca mulatta]